MKKIKANRSIIIVTFVLIAGMTFILATSAEKKEPLSLLEQVSEDLDLDLYADFINNVSEDTARVTSNYFDLFIKNTIFTDHDVYAIISLKDKKVEELNLSGRIVDKNSDQPIYILDGESKEIEQKDGIRYFFYTGKIAEPIESTKHSQLLMTAGDYFLKFNSLRDFEGMLLEFSVNLHGSEQILTTTVNQVFTNALTFQPDGTTYAGDFYESVTLTPYELKLEGKSESLVSADENKWEQPHFSVTIVRKNNVDIEMRFDTRGSISDEGFPLSLSRGHSSDTGEFYHFWDFREWELDLDEVTWIIIDGEKYKVR